MILKLLITKGNITLIPKDATQEKENFILKPENVKKKDKKNNSHFLQTHLYFKIVLRMGYDPT